MQFVQFPNGKVWPVNADGFITGTVEVPNYTDYGLDEKLDAVSEEVAGDVCVLSSVSLQHLGASLVQFTSYVEDLPPLLDPAVEGLRLKEALSKQYGLLPVEAEHLMANLGTSYPAETSLPIAGSMRKICCPAYPAECSYVRVVVDGFEIAYWTEDDWRDDPACVMGAFLGAANGSRGS